MLVRFCSARLLPFSFSHYFLCTFLALSLSDFHLSVLSNSTHDQKHAGVESIDVNMKDQKLTVVGTMDPVELAEKLGKLCPTEIVAVGPAKEAQKKDDGKKDNPDKKKDDGKNKPKDPKPHTPMVYFQHGFYGPPPPPPPYYPGHYQPPPPPPPYYPGHYQPPPPPPIYYYGGYVSIEEDPNACVIC